MFESLFWTKEKMGNKSDYASRAAQVSYVVAELIRNEIIYFPQHAFVADNNECVGQHTTSLSLSQAAAAKARKAVGEVRNFDIAGTTLIH